MSLLFAIMTTVVLRVRPVRCEQAAGILVPVVVESLTAITECHGPVKFSNSSGGLITVHAMDLL